MNYLLPVSVTRAVTAAALLASIAMTAVFGASQAVAADAYPSRRITLVIPYPAGGATDVLGRLLANKLSESWKTTVVVENKSGGGGVVGNDFVAKAQPDGYTVLLAITQIIQAPSLVPKLPYDVFKDLTPVTQVALSTIVLVVPEQQPFKSVKELVDYAKANPGKPYGTFGNATTSHLYGELLKKVANIDMTHIPYRGSAPLTNDLLNNTVITAFQDLTTAHAQIKAGKFRALAVGGEQRRKAMPDVPTMGELGYPGFEIEGWLGVFVPAATPKDIVKKLSDELARIVASPEGIAGIETLSLVPVGGSPEDFDKALRRDLDKWADVVKQTGVKGE
ncbi:Bug family tripartite tricarboxylate transporter substrate binding protein [Bradyrhizobium roseum]|uniref:Bug family tripartite tricarboxylate transporter substrate binding protein n=1 Tax=Bradyrhizobium roseum TaxID=3056648 RepID=UPI00262F5235|nr:tripartite tricarboxylate transporter substrate binding protein [Bradyrhizobium roseus]WKA28625.1 tripartite tricarboxylate transporter substrate binding protein [Bradyrhizobium roseus]